MIEKVNPMHPDKVADRIAGAIVDIAYASEENPKIATEVLIGHGVCHAIIETSANIDEKDIADAILRIAGNIQTDIVIVPQDIHLSENQKGNVRCGDNGIFKGMPLTREQKELSQIARDIYRKYPTDGKYILDGVRLIICQSNADKEELENHYPGAEVNPLGAWAGGTDVDTGATNRKLGSDMADSVTGGGLHGKDLSNNSNEYSYVVDDDMVINGWYFEDGKPVQKIGSIGYQSYCAWGVNQMARYKTYMIKEWVYSYNGYRNYKDLYLYTPYLATINNLDTPVIKTADKTMKITYTLTETKE